MTVRTTLRAAVTFEDPKALLFFTRTPASKQAAREYLARLAERRADRDQRVSPAVFRTQLAAVHRWGQQEHPGRSAFTGRVLVVHGEDDLMVPVANADRVARQFATSTIWVFPDSGHGVAFQYHDAFIGQVREFLRR